MIFRLFHIQICCLLDFFRGNGDIAVFIFRFHQDFFRQECNVVVFVVQRIEIFHGSMDGVNVARRAVIEGAHDIAIRIHRRVSELDIVTIQNGSVIQRVGIFVCDTRDGIQIVGTDGDIQFCHIESRRIGRFELESIEIIFDGIVFSEFHSALGDGFEFHTCDGVAARFVGTRAAHIARTPINIDGERDCEQTHGIDLFQYITFHVGAVNRIQFVNDDIQIQFFRNFRCRRCPHRDCACRSGTGHSLLVKGEFAFHRGDRRGAVRRTDPVRAVVIIPGGTGFADPRTVGRGNRILNCRNGAGTGRVVTVKCYSIGSENIKGCSAEDCISCADRRFRIDRPVHRMEHLETADLNIFFRSAGHNGIQDRYCRRPACLDSVSAAVCHNGGVDDINFTAIAVDIDRAGGAARTHDGGIDQIQSSAIGGAEIEGCPEAAVAAGGIGQCDIAHIRRSRSGDPDRTRTD